MFLIQSLLVNCVWYGVGQRVHSGSDSAFKVTQDLDLCHGSQEKSWRITAPGPRAVKRWRAAHIRPASNRVQQRQDQGSAPAAASPSRPAVRCAGATWRRSPMAAVRAIHAGGDGRRAAGEYAAPVGVTGRIAPAISDRASWRALRVVGAAGRSGSCRTPECVTPGLKGRSLKAAFTDRRARAVLAALVG